jgi:hypothetical protein
MGFHLTMQASIFSLKLNLGPSGPQTDYDENRKISRNEGDAFDPE